MNYYMNQPDIPGRMDGKGPYMYRGKLITEKEKLAGGEKRAEDETDYRPRGAFRAVVKLDAGGNVVDRYKSVGIAARCAYISRTAMQNWIKNRTVVDGYTWAYE